VDLWGGGRGRGAGSSLSPAVWLVPPRYTPSRDSIVQSAKIFEFESAPDCSIYRSCSHNASRVRVHTFGSQNCTGRRLKTILDPHAAFHVRIRFKPQGRLPVCRIGLRVRHLRKWGLWCSLGLQGYLTHQKQTSPPLGPPKDRR
jgi:hypothetical protein